ncbi:MAG: V-type ATP synthase subunit D [Verrucomicrobia bacterium]|nr:V-type ATP synthase subunit D [Verrucomicrobiota bacterium]
MADVKLTKTELRNQQLKHDRLQKYLPTLQLKKAMLQVEVNLAQAEIEGLRIDFSTAQGHVGKYCSLFTDKNAPDLFSAVEIVQVEKSFENVAGVDIPIFERVVFAPSGYSLFDTPIWFEAAIEGVKDLLTAREKIAIAEEKKRLLEKELREVSIRVNLFEKILIPRAQQNIKKIKIFLGDQQLAAVSQAKVAKKKIQMRNEGKGR